MLSSFAGNNDQIVPVFKIRIRVVADSCSPIILPLSDFEVRILLKKFKKYNQYLQHYVTTIKTNKNLYFAFKLQKEFTEGEIPIAI